MLTPQLGMITTETIASRCFRLSSTPWTRSFEPVFDTGSRLLATPTGVDAKWTSTAFEIVAKPRL